MGRTGRTWWQGRQGLFVDHHAGKGIVVYTLSPWGRNNLNRRDGPRRRACAVSACYFSHPSSRGPGTCTLGGGGAEEGGTEALVTVSKGARLGKGGPTGLWRGARQWAFYGTHIVAWTAQLA